MGACGSARPAFAPGKQRDLHLGSELDYGLVANSEKKMMGPPGVGLPMGVGVACRKGVKTTPLPNQDSWCVQVAAGESSAIGVFDGHGATGHLISHAVKSRLTDDTLRAVTSSSKGVVVQVQGQFRRAHQRLCATGRLRARNSGTTATVVVHDVQRERLVVSHVGDSKAVLLHRSAEGGGLAAEELTQDHHPDLPEERERIIRARGIVAFDGHCHRIKARRSDGGGLNMSRSLGDAASHAIGVSEVPTVRVLDLAPSAVAMIVASDGVWEVVSPKEAAAIVDGYAPSQANEAAARLVDEAMSRWLRETKGSLSDDITAVVAWLGTARADSINSTLTPKSSEAAWWSSTSSPGSP